MLAVLHDSGILPPNVRFEFVEMCYVEWIIGTSEEDRILVSSEFIQIGEIHIAQMALPRSIRWNGARGVQTLHMIGSVASITDDHACVALRSTTKGAGYFSDRIGVS